MRFYARLGSEGERPLSPTTIAHTHSLINSAMKWAHRKGRTNRNIMSRVDAPQRKKSEADALQIEEALKLLEVIKGHRLEAAMKFSLGTGMRRGVVCGLKWSSIDFDAANVLVRQARVNVKGRLQKETKTKRVRTIPLGDLAMEGARLARKQYSERKMRSRPLFVDSGFVFIDEVARALHPNALTDAFRRVFVKLQKQGLPHRTLHDLRHTAGTFMLASAWTSIRYRCCWDTRPR
jgi:integrase